jgi:cell division transport system permease protein
LAQAYGSTFQLAGLPVSDGMALVASGILLGWAGAFVSVGSRLALIEPR